MFGMIGSSTIVAASLGVALAVTTALPDTARAQDCRSRGQLDTLYCDDNLDLVAGVPTDVISFCTAIARGLGFGHWLISDYQPHKRLVIQCTSTYEVPFYRSRYGLAKKPRSYFVQGAALAFMVLAESVKWTERPQLTNNYYVELFRSKPRYRVEQTKCLMRGDAISELVVEAL